MKSILKSSLFVGLLTILLPSISFAQPVEIAISDEGSHESINCQQYLILTDSNVDDGNYAENESFETTLCFSTTESDIAQIQILPTNPVTGNIWDVDGNSSLFIYEGTNTTGTLIGEFNSVTDPDGVFFTTDQECLTFLFISGEGSSGEGFIAEFKCVEELQPFNMTVAAISPTEYSLQDFDGLNSDDSVLTICYQDSISFQALLNFPLSDATGNGYEQTLETTNIIWDWGDGTETEQGLGLDINGHIYEPFGGFLLTITAEDEEGQRELVRINVLVAPRPVFTGFLFDDTLCIGDTTRLTGGILFQDTVGVDRSTGAINIYLDSTDSLELPDVPAGLVTTYPTGINISNYADDPIITNIGDLASICLNMEHSYLGDLEAWLTCPNGQSAALFDGFAGEGLYPGPGFGGGGTWLGDAHGATDQDIPGIGFDYCFQDDAPLGTMAEEFAAGNTVFVNSFPDIETGNAMIGGTYDPEEAFLSSFLGCPVNGEWILSITDNLGSDDGWIFSWNIEFSSEFYIDTVYYSPTIVDAYWEDNPDIVINNDTIVSVVPSSPGNNAFTFIVEDSFGCSHDTTFNVYVRPPVSINDAIACDLTHTLAPDNALDAAWEIIDTPSDNSVVAWEPIDGTVAAYNIIVNEYGLYEFKIQEGASTCGYEDNAIIDFRPDPLVSELIGDTTLCIGATVELSVGPQEDNSSHFSVIWTRDGNGVASDVYNYTVDETGQYVVTVIGVCASDADTVNIVAIDMNFEGNTVCDTVTFVGVSIEPEGTGIWTSNSDDITFSNPDIIATQISSLNYGLYEITFTDDRCVNDGLTREFRFVEQPTIIILPEDPDFCVDEDALTFSATVEGSNTGDFNWTVNGTPLLSTNDTIYFPVLTFTPNELNTLEAMAMDPFGVCGPGTGINTFIGDWCEYEVPNVITPNDDGKNDRFHIRYLELIPGAQLSIYDRWGTVVFEHSDYGSYQVDNHGKDMDLGGWDPSDAGTGTFYYELLLPSIDKIETGYIQVLDGDAKE